MCVCVCVCVHACMRVCGCGIIVGYADVSTVSQKLPPTKAKPTLAERHMKREEAVKREQGDPAFHGSVAV